MKKTEAKRWSERRLPAIALILGYATVSILFGALLEKMVLPEQLLGLLLVPIVIASVNHTRAIYLAMIFVFGAVTVWVTSDLAIFFYNSLQTVLATIAIAVGMCEAVSALAHRGRQSEEALRKSEERYRELFENANDILYTHDLEGRITSLNKAGERITGLTRDKLLGREIWRLLPEEHREIAREMTLRKLSKDSPTQYEIGIVTKDGGRVVLEVSTRLVSEKGEPTGVQGVARDITERKRAEEAFRQESQFRQAIIEHSAQGLCVFHATDDYPKMKFTVWNRRMIDITGYIMDEINRVGWYQSVYPDPELQSRAVERMIRMREGDDLVGEEWTITRKNGEPRTISISTSLIRGIWGSDDRAHVLALMTDITDRKREEEERRRLETQVQYTQKLESLGVLAGGIAHDFNNLLVGMLGFADLALESLPQNSPERDSVEKIRMTAMRAADLTRQMLAYSGGGKFVVKPINVSAVVEEMSRLLASAISKKAQIKCAFEPDLPAIEADVNQIRQVVMNLITNASEALGDEDGTISIATGVRQLDTLSLQATYPDGALPAGAYVFLRVSDTGCGMDGETQARIFDPFFTTKFTGRGLGLSAVLGIVRGHGGAIRLDSLPGKGTTFELFFPTYHKRAEPLEEKVRPKPQHGSETILVVDDEEIVRNFTAEVLQATGYTVLTAVDGGDAIAVFKAHAHEIDAVLLDLTMPHLDGRQVFSELRLLQPNVRVVLSSGYSEEQATREFVDTGLAGFLQKPYLASELTETLQGALRS